MKALDSDLCNKWSINLLLLCVINLCLYKMITYGFFIFQMAVPITITSSVPTIGVLPSPSFVTVLTTVGTTRTKWAAPVSMPGTL